MLDKIKQVVEPILEEEGVELVDLVLRREAGRQVLRLLVDRQGGIMLSDCVRLNEEISQELDKDSVINEDYTLEVDSPGVDRWFSSKRDYERARGRMVRVTLNEAIMDKKEYIGRLREALEDYIKVEVEKKGIIDIPLEKIVRARQEVEFKNTR